ncbi:MAG: ankyrin repeat domain-containing protein [Anaerolineae bacterium]|nr:ankyrin repeat domain-containing protein [Anaerolineae bacterium]
MFQTRQSWPQWLVLIGLLTSFVTAAGNQPDQSAILLAAEHGDLTQYRRLKAQGADLNAVDGRGYTLLHLATQSGNGDLVGEILGDGASMTAGGRVVAGLTIKPPSPLVMAAENKDRAIMTLLLERGANPNVGFPKQRGSVGMYLLDNPGLVSADLLAKLSIDPDFKPSGQATMLGYALEIGDPEMVERYLSRGASMGRVSNGSIFRACAIDMPFERYQRIVGHVLAAIGNDRRFLDGCLLGAVTGNHGDRVTDLLQRGAPVKNALLRNNGWNTMPLETAIEYKRFGIAIQLINAGARSDFKYLSHWKIMDQLTDAMEKDSHDIQSQEVALLLLRQPTIVSADSLTHPYAERSIERLGRSPNQAIRSAAQNMVLLDRSSMQRISLPR